MPVANITINFHITLVIIFCFFVDFHINILLIELVRIINSLMSNSKIISAIRTYTFIVNLMYSGFDDCELLRKSMGLFSTLNIYFIKRKLTFVKVKKSI